MTALEYGDESVRTPSRARQGHQTDRAADDREGSRHAPEDTRLGDILLADSTIFTTLFGGTESLTTLAKHRDDITIAPAHSMSTHAS